MVLRLHSVGIFRLQEIVLRCFLLSIELFIARIHKKDFLLKEDHCWLAVLAELHQHSQVSRGFVAVWRYANAHPTF